MPFFCASLVCWLIVDQQWCCEAISWFESIPDDCRGSTAIFMVFASYLMVPMLLKTQNPARLRPSLRPRLSPLRMTNHETFPPTQASLDLALEGKNCCESPGKWETPVTQIDSARLYRLCSARQHEVRQMMQEKSAVRTKVFSNERLIEYWSQNTYSYILPFGSSLPGCDLQVVLSLGLGSMADFHCRTWKWKDPQSPFRVIQPCTVYSPFFEVFIIFASLNQGPLTSWPKRRGLGPG